MADLKLEKEQLLKAVTEQQHDAACLAEHVAQIGQLKQVLANLQQHNAELETTGKASGRLSMTDCYTPHLSTLTVVCFELCQSELTLLCCTGPAS